MKAIKTGLMVMGVLIVVGFSFLGYVLYQRMTGTGYFAKNHVETAPIDFAALGLPTPIPSHPPSVALHLGNDAQVVAMHDFNNRILLLIRQPKVGDRLYMVEPRTGAVISAMGIGDTLPPVPENAPANAPGQAPAATAPTAAPVAVAAPAPASPKAAAPAAAPVKAR